MELHWDNLTVAEQDGANGICYFKESWDAIDMKFWNCYDDNYELKIEEIADLVAAGTDEETAKNTAPILLQAKYMLIRWEQKDASVLALWEKMNARVYEGFDETYKRLGVHCDSYYYESNTYV